MQLENAQMVSGTTGNPDYLVISTSQGLCLSIKPVFEPAQGVVVIGVRLRAMEYTDIESKVATIVANKNIGKYALEVFSDIPFKKVQSSYASVFIGTPLHITSKEEFVALEDILNEKNLLGELKGVWGGILDKSDIPLNHDLKDIESYITEAIVDTFKGVLQSYGITSEKKPSKSNPAKVLAFPSNDKTKH
ncbi:MAG: hypothetical protein GQ570_04065 [Helicobacteraceae bacterium]|nr:hypothetical protein [Helicobacteraceae bacterium]